MRSPLCAAFVLALVLGGAATASAAPETATTAAPDSAALAAALAAKPALWAQAVRVFETNKEFVPAKISQKVFELDDKGNAKSTTDAEVALSLDDSGKIKSDILKVTKDGKDITGEERKKAAEREEKAAKAEAKREAERKAGGEGDAKKDDRGDEDEGSHSMSLGDGPFDPGIQADVFVKELSDRETIEGRSCVLYEYSYPDKKKPSKGKPARVAGKAWIEESSGNPVRVEFTSDPLPKGVKSMSTSLVYGPEADKWIVKSMNFEARAAFLIIKKRIRGDMVFSDYWKYVEPKEE
jgi:hypothetical protein